MKIVVMCNDSFYSTNFLSKLTSNHNYTVISPTKPYPNKGVLKTVLYVRKTRGLKFIFKRFFQNIKNSLITSQQNNLKSICKKLEFELIKCKVLDSQEIIAKVKSLEPDIICSISLNHLVPKNIFSLSKFLSVNIHPSLLPSYRGPSPIFWVLHNKEKYSGITIHELTPKFDKGKIIYQKKYSILGMNEKELSDKSSEESAFCFNHLLENLTNLKDIEVDSSLKESYYPRPTYRERIIFGAK